MDFRQFSAKTVDEAITRACIELGLSSDRLEIQVISEGSSGFLGIGSKPAVIQVREKETPADEGTTEPEKETPAVAEKPASEADRKEEKVKAENTSSAAVSSNTSVCEKTPAEENAGTGSEPDTHRRQNSGKASEKKDVKNARKGSYHSDRDESSSREEHEEKPIADHNDEEIAAMKASAEKFLKDIFAAMEMPVQMTMEYSHEEGSLNIDLEGDDMGILIGKRGQTLDSLQYLVSLVVNREQKNYVRVKLDTEDYRRRRTETLENLAKNIAYKVKRTHRPVSLEAMNPYERRIIHSALQGNRYVETHSEGNEPYRYVVITPKKRSDRDEQDF